MLLLHFTNSEGIRLELGKPKDAKTIGLMSRDLIENGLGWTWTPLRVAKHIFNPNSLVVVARSKKTVCGFVILQFTEKTANMSLLAVDPSFQRKGIGSDLVRFVEQSANAAGLASIFLEVREINKGALIFYRSHGYRQINLLPRYYRNRETAIRMVYQLKVPIVPDNTKHRSTS
ncbi:MAG: GNAT family N-acetyltransferase [SAR324 cluster bacterium]|nr:GNAT family N-acetyltransferase [SAR324 cluster bacterium]